MKVDNVIIRLIHHMTVCLSYNVIVGGPTAAPTAGPPKCKHCAYLCGLLILAFLKSITIHEIWFHSHLNANIF